MNRKLGTSGQYAVLATLWGVSVERAKQCERDNEHGVWVLYSMMSMSVSRDALWEVEFRADSGVDMTVTHTLLP